MSSRTRSALRSASGIWLVMVSSTVCNDVPTAHGGSVKVMPPGVAAVGIKFVTVAAKTELEM